MEDAIPSPLPLLCTAVSTAGSSWKTRDSLLFGLSTCSKTLGNRCGIHLLLQQAIILKLFNNCKWLITCMSSLNAHVLTRAADSGLLCSAGYTFSKANCSPQVCTILYKGRRNGLFQHLLRCHCKDTVEIGDTERLILSHVSLLVLIYVIVSLLNKNDDITSHDIQQYYILYRETTVNLVTVLFCSSWTFSKCFWPHKTCTLSGQLPLYMDNVYSSASRLGPKRYYFE